MKLEKSKEEVEDKRHLFQIKPAQDGCSKEALFNRDLTKKREQQHI